MKPWLTLIICLVLVLPLVYADHLGPQRPLDGKYVAILTVLPEGETITLRLMIHDMQSGKEITTLKDVELSIVADKTEESIVLNHPLTQQRNHYYSKHSFEKSGLYKAYVTFELEGKKYMPEAWSLWIPGIDNVRTYPLGMSELAGIGMLIVSLLIVAHNFYEKKKANTSKGRIKSPQNRQ